MIPEAKLKELRERIVVEDVIGQYVALKSSGRQFKGLCPFHAEKTPSFYVHPDRRSFKCFGCGEYGDAIEFIQKVEGTSFLETVRRLADQFAVPLPSEVGGARNARDANERDLDLRVTECAATFFRRVLVKEPVGETGRAYAAKRGVGAETSEIFRMGYAPSPEEAGWDALVKELTARGHDLERAERLGLVAKSERNQNYYDRFRGRLMFPVIRPGGSVLGFSGRILPIHDSSDDQDPTPKYINSSESDLYAKNKTLFGLQAASRHIKTSGRALLVEGNLDVVSLHQRGHGEALAPLGTSFTREQCAVLGRLTSVVVICFDGDRAGRKATASAIEQLLSGDIEPRVVSLEPGEDPDSVDPEVFKRRLERPTPALEWFLRRLVAAGATESIESKARALHRVAPLLQKLKDPDVRGDYAHLAANLLSLPISRVWSAAQPQSRGWAPPNDPRNAPPPSRDRQPTQPQTALPRGQALLTALLVDLPMAAGGAVRDQVLEHVDDPRLSPIVERVLEAASEGRHATVGELLALVEPEAEQLLHRAIFQGRFLEETRPNRVLQQGLTLCKVVKIESQIPLIDHQTDAARRDGREEEVRALIQRRLELRKEQAALRATLRDDDDPLP